MNCSYIMSHQEIKLLLFSLGYTQVAGLPLTDASVGTNESITVLNNLYKNNLLTRSKKGFAVESRLKRIISIIGQSEDFFLINSSNPELPNLSCYESGDEIVLCSVVMSKSDSIKLSLLHKDCFYEMLTDDNYLPNGNGFDAFDEERIVEFEKAIGYKFNVLEVLPEDSKVVFKVSRCNRNGEVLSEIAVINYYLYNYLVITEYDSQKRLLYTSELLKDLFEKYIVNKVLI